MSVEHWEAFYRGGSIATCPTGPDANYSLDIRDAWVGFFANLPEGARVLDVGTGNGAIALIARDAANAMGRRFEIHASDLALIDPPRRVPGGKALFDGITFHPGVATEQLPFEANSFDAISGQFALEYTDVDRSLREIFRVLKPGSPARFSLHHADSVVVQNARLSLGQAHMVLDESLIYRRLRGFVAAEREANGRARAATAWNELRTAAATIQQAAATTENSHVLRVTLDAVHKLAELSRQTSPSQIEHEIDRVERDLRASVRRLRDLLGAARSEAAIAELAGVAEAAGLESQPPKAQFQTGSVLIAWLLDVRKPDSGTALAQSATSSTGAGSGTGR